MNKPVHIDELPFATPTQTPRSLEASLQKNPDNVADRAVAKKAAGPPSDPNPAILIGTMTTALCCENSEQQRSIATQSGRWSSGKKVVGPMKTLGSTFRAEMRLPSWRVWPSN
jgi:hypothetical protein